MRLCAPSVAELAPVKNEQGRCPDKEHDTLTPPVRPALTAGQRQAVIALDRLILAGSRHWLLSLNILLVVFVVTPWLAPVFMQTGHPRAAGAIYVLYSTQCHQLPQRSFFLFGPQASYSLNEIQAAWRDTENPLILRQFIGNPELGWKVAWSDRMVGMYTSIFVLGLLYALVRGLKPLSLWAFVALIIPMMIDGGTHMLSDLAGLGQGFRDSNAWLAALTGSALPAWFYAGDALGSFNSWMRLLTGTLFGLAIVWLAYPYLERYALETRERLEANLHRAGVVA
jgi:uncharacterized membrane protein